MKRLKAGAFPPFLPSVLRFLCFLILPILLAGCGEDDDPQADASCEPGDPGCDDEDITPPMMRPVCEAKPSGATLQRDDVLAEGEFEVASLRGLRWTRPARCYASGENLPCDRTLVFDLRFPATRDAEGELSPIDEAVPLLVYGHGFSSSRAENPRLLALLASRGVASIAVQFPRTALGSVREIGDVVNQPSDVSALIDWALGEAALEGADAPPEGLRIDEDKLIVGGVSLGGMTSLLSAFHRDLGDPRLDFGFALAPPASMFLESFYEERPDLPFLLVAATSDAIVPYELSGVSAFEKMGPAAAFVSIEGGTHIGVTEQGALFANQPHPDGPACGILGIEGRDDDEDGESDENDTDEGGGETLGRYGELGGVEAGIDPNAPLGRSCSFKDRPTAISPHAQLEIVRLAVLSFVESRIRGDDMYEAYLREGLTPETCWGTYTPPRAE